MKKTTQHSSPLAATIHETAERLYAGGLMNNLTMSGNVFADIGFTRCSTSTIFADRQI